MRDYEIMGLRKYRNCPVCGCDNKLVLNRMKNTMPEDMQQRTGYPSEYAIVSCDNCGMVYTDIDISAKNIDIYYSNENIYDNMSVLKSSIYEKSQEMYYSHIDKYVNFQSTLIDVGCGNGSFLTFLQDKGFTNLCGIDPSVKSVEVLMNNGINGRVGSVYRCDALDVCLADMVISTGVLEHLLFPGDALKRMAVLLNAGGYMYICVPAAERYKDVAMPEANFFNHEHINHFTEKTLGALAESVGLKIVESTVDRACEDIEYTVNLVLEKKNDCQYKHYYDYMGMNSIKAYFQNRRDADIRNDDIMKTLIDGGRPVVIWGTGNYASSLMQKYPELIKDVVFFIDNNKGRTGAMFYGRRVYTPEVLSATGEGISKNAVLLVCVMQAKDEIRGDIDSLKINNDVIFL